MNLNVDLGSLQWKQLRPGRKIIAIAMVTLLFAVAAFGYWHHINNWCECGTDQGIHIGLRIQSTCGQKMELRIECDGTLCTPPK